MKHLFAFLTLLLCTACIENAIDSRGGEEQDEQLSLHSLLGGTKAADAQEDSLTMVSRIQSDVDMMNLNEI